MVRKAVSWVLVGAFAFLWWWVGHRWQFINVKGNEWGTIFVLFTLISLAVLTRSRKAAGAGMLDGLVGTVRGFLPYLLWLALAIIVARAIAWVLLGGVADPLDHFIHAVVAVVAAGFTTSLWYGAIVNGTDDS